MKQVISLGSGLGGDKFMEVGVFSNWANWWFSAQFAKASRALRALKTRLKSRSEFLVQSTAVDRHNFKGSLGITLQCLKALWRSYEKLQMGK